MEKRDMLYYFLNAAMNNRKKIKVSGGKAVVKKVYVNEVKIENDVVMFDVDGEQYAIDLKTNEVKTGFFDQRVLHISGDEPFKIQLN